jgi:acyl carrier protein
MSIDNISKEIIAIISEVSGEDERKISPESNLADDLEIDSIKAIEITVAIEKKFKISIRDEDIPKVINVKDTIVLVEDLIKKGGQN